MNALAKQHLMPSIDIAGSYAEPMNKKENEEFRPAGNATATRDFSSEARKVQSIIEQFVEAEQQGVEGQNGPDNSTVIDLYKRRTEIERLVSPEITHKPDPTQAYFFSTQEWNGYITAIRDDEFDARVYAIGESENLRDDTVTIPLSLVDDSARNAVQLGAIFRLATGRYRRKRQIINGAKIYFRKSVEVRKHKAPTRQAIEEFFAD